MTFAPREDSGQVALINKAANEGNLCEIQTAFEQQTLRSFDSPFCQPLVRRHAGRLPKRAGKMAGGQAAFSREIGDRCIAVEVGFDKFICPPKLPGCKPRSERTSASKYATIGMHDMGMECECDRIEKERRR